MAEVPEEELRRHRIQVLIIFLPMTFALVVAVLAVVRSLT
jgi:hypothetical protein